MFLGTLLMPNNSSDPTPWPLYTKVDPQPQEPKLKIFFAEIFRVTITRTLIQHSLLYSHILYSIFLYSLFSVLYSYVLYSISANYIITYHNILDSVQCSLMESLRRYSNAGTLGVVAK